MVLVQKMIWLLSYLETSPFIFPPCPPPQPPKRRNENPRFSHTISFRSPGWCTYFRVGKRLFFLKQSVIHFLVTIFPFPVRPKKKRTKDKRNINQFTLTVESNSHFLRLCITTLCDWLVNATSSTNQKKTRTHRDSLTVRVIA